MADKGWIGMLGDLAGAVGNGIGSCIPGMDGGGGKSSGSESSSPGTSGNGSNYGSDGSYVDSSRSSDGGNRTVRRDRNNDVTWESEKRGDRTVHWFGGRSQSVNPTHYSIDRGNGVVDHYRYSDNAALSRSITQLDGSIDDYDHNGNYTGHRSAK